MLRAIVVDDEPYICQMISAMVQWEEFGIELAGLASDGLDVWECIQTERPDIVITDIRMPGIDGLELIRRSRALYQEHPVHFVVISGFDCFSYAQTAIKYGVSDYILKPINQKELQSVLRKIVEEQRTVQEEQEARTQLLEDMHDAKRKLKEEFLRKLVLPPGRREGHLAPEKAEGFSVLLDGEFRVLHVLLDMQEEGVVAVYRENCMKCVCEKIRQAAEPLCSSVEQVRGELFLLHYPAQEWMRIEAALQDTLHQVRMN